MPIEVSCQCGAVSRAKDEYAGRKAICPSCKRELMIEAPIDPLMSSEPVLSNEPPPLPVSLEAKRRWWRDPIIVVSTMVPAVIVLLFCAYVVGSRSALRESAPISPAVATVPAETPTQSRNPKIPIELSYPVIEEIFSPPRTSPLFPVKRLVYVRLNMKVSEEVLREICLAIKAKEIAQFEYTYIDVWLPGKGPGLGGGDSWASADFSSGLKVHINGLSIEGEKYYRTSPLFLPEVASDIAIWLIDEGTASSQIVFYRIDDEWRWHFRDSDEAKQKHILLSELPDSDGRCLQPTDSSDRYILLPNGDLELYSGSGKLLHHVKQQTPAPPIQRTSHVSEKIR